MAIQNKNRLMLGYASHIIAFIVSSTGLIFSLLYIKDEDGNNLFYYRGWPGKIKYITFWCAVILPVYFFISIINDFAGKKKATNRQQRNSSLHTFRDRFHACVAFPIAIFVSSTFWGIYAVDRELVYPKALDKVIPVWHNHIVHTGPIVFMLCEKIFVNISYPSKVGVIGPLLIGLLYQIWILWMSLSLDIYVYPILKVLDSTKKLMFFAALWVYLVVIYFCGQWLSKQLWKGPSYTTMGKKVK